METKITAHCLVKNEERFVWYSVMSVIDWVDEVLLWDTGSTDKTIEIVKLIEQSNDKVKTKSLKISTPEQFTAARQKMLDKTKNSWFLVVDGDEVWWDESIKKVTDFIRKQGKRFESVVVPTINLVGDMFHYQEEGAGRYKLAGRRGHLALRGVNRKIQGLHSARPHGTWGWADQKEKQIQDRDQKKIKFIKAAYLHMSFLRRSTDRGDLEVMKRAKKLKHEIGNRFPSDYYYPEVFFKPKPDIVPNVWEPMSFQFKQRAFIETPLRRIKRKVLPVRVGY